MNNINFELLRKQREQLLSSIFEDEDNALWALVDELDKVIELENG
jgi:hypothetical protein